MGTPGYEITRLEPCSDRMIADWWSVVKDDPQPGDKDNGAYLVKVNVRGEWTCTCPHFKIRLKNTGLACKHVGYVKEEFPPRPPRAPDPQPEPLLAETDLPF